MQGPTYGCACCSLLSVERRLRRIMFLSLSEGSAEQRQRNSLFMLPLYHMSFLRRLTVKRDWCVMHAQATSYGQLAAKRRKTQHCCPLNRLPQWEILMVSWSKPNRFGANQTGLLQLGCPPAVVHTHSTFRVEVLIALLSGVHIKDIRNVCSQGSTSLTCRAS